MSRLFATLALLTLALPAAAETTAIVGGKIHTVGPQGTIENGTVLIVDGRIAAVGSDVAVPANAETYHLIDSKALSAMQPHAHFINIARGALVRITSTTRFTTRMSCSPTT